MTREEFLELEGEFTWSFHDVFHIKTSTGCFEWSDPEYGGNNTIIPTENLSSWCKRQEIPFGRDKGIHKIKDYCGVDVSVTL